MAPERFVWVLRRSIALALAAGLLAVAHAARPMPETFFGDHGFPPMPALPPHDYSLDLSHPPLPALPPHDFDLFSHPPVGSLFDKPALAPLHSEGAKKESFFGDHAFPPVAFPPSHDVDPTVIFSHPPLPALPPHDFSLDLSHPPLPSLTFDKPALAPHPFIDPSVILSHPPLSSLHSEGAKKESFFGDHAYPPVAFPPSHDFDPSVIFSHPPLPALPPHDFSLDLSHPPLPSLTFDKPALPPHEFIDPSVILSHPPLPSLTHKPIVLVRPHASRLASTCRLVVVAASAAHVGGVCVGAQSLMLSCMAFVLLHAVCRACTLLAGVQMASLQMALFWLLTLAGTVRCRQRPTRHPASFRRSP